MQENCARPLRKLRGAFFMKSKGRRPTNRNRNRNRSLPWTKPLARSSIRDLVNIWLERAIDDGRSNQSSISSPVWLNRSHPHVRADPQPNFLHTRIFLLTAELTMSIRRIEQDSVYWREWLNGNINLTKSPDFWSKKNDEDIHVAWQTAIPSAGKCPRSALQFPIISEPPTKFAISPATHVALIVSLSAATLVRISAPSPTSSAPSPSRLSHRARRS